MEMTAAALARATAFARAVEPNLPLVDQGFAALRQMLAEAGVSYVFVGGVAVVHHGYLRTTRDLDLLLEREALARVRPLLARHGFEVLAENRLRHVPSDVTVDLLFAGDAMPRPEGRPYPRPQEVTRSAQEPDVADLPPLVEMKLDAGRHQDVADVVALLKLLDEPGYLRLEAAVRPPLRARLLELRREALEELRWQRPQRET